MYCRQMPNSVFSRLLEGMYMGAVHKSDFPLEKISRSYKLGMTLLTVAAPARVLDVSGVSILPTPDVCR